MIHAFDIAGGLNWLCILSFEQPSLGKASETLAVSVLVHTLFHTDEQS